MSQKLISKMLSGKAVYSDNSDRIAEHFLDLNGSKIRQRSDVAMKDKRYGSDSAYT